MKTLATALLLICSSCATAIHGRFQSVPVSSSPTGASIAVDCDGDRRDAGTTPAKVTLPRKAETCSLTLSKPGYEPQRVWFDRVRSNATIADVVASVPLGIAGAIVGFFATLGSGDPGTVTAGATMGGAAGAQAPQKIDERSGAAYKQVPAKVDVTLVPSSLPDKPASPEQSPRFGKNRGD